jgi:hypothetical protein
MRVEAVDRCVTSVRKRLLRVAAASTLGLLAAVVLSSAALAQEGGGSLKLGSANVDITPAQPGKVVQVREEIELGGEAQGLVENVSPVLPGAQINNLRIIAAGKEVRPTVKADAGLRTVSFQPPEGKPVSYEVRYEVATTGSRIPLLVPAYAGGGSQVVDLVCHVPGGYYLQGSPFPAVSGSEGDVGRKLQAVPMFADFTIAQSPPGIFTSFNIAGGAVILVVVVLSVLVVFVESRAARRGEVGV